MIPSRLRLTYHAIANALKTARMQCCDYDSIEHRKGRINALQAHDHTIRELCELFRKDTKFDETKFKKVAGYGNYGETR